MKNKIAFSFLALVGTFLFLAIGWVLGATWGGNYDEDFVAFGVRGYEAWGLIGGWIGIAVGVVGSFFSYRKLFRKVKVVV